MWTVPAGPSGRGAQSQLSKPLVLEHKSGEDSKTKDSAKEEAAEAAVRGDGAAGGDGVDMGGGGADAGVGGPEAGVYTLNPDPPNVNCRL
jgi:hypothetical protein